MVSVAAAAPSLCCWDGEGREGPRGPAATGR